MEAIYKELVALVDEMDTLTTLAGISSILGLIVSSYAAFQARSASKAASAARDAVLVHSLANELQLACTHAEQLLDFLQHARYSEANLRVDELILSLSELPHLRSPHLTIIHQDLMLTSRQQLLSISEAILKNTPGQGYLVKEQIIMVSRRVSMNLREILGEIKSHIEQGELR